MTHQAATRPARVRQPRKALSKATGSLPVPLAAYCEVCAGHRSIWCPDCFGFEGCRTCRRTYKMPCPACAGGTLEPIRW